LPIDVVAKLQEFIDTTVAFYVFHLIIIIFCFCSFPVVASFVEHVTYWLQNYAFVWLIRLYTLRPN